MLRSITLALLMLVSVGVMLPIASSTAHGIRQSVGAKSNRKFKRHSRAWWRRYRARLRARRASALAAHRNRPLSQLTPPAGAAATASSPKLPAGWNPQTANSAEMKFRTDNGAAAVPGQAALSVVAMSRPTPEYLTAREQKRILSGVSHSELKRIVIDKMVANGGWVTNDYEREVTGRRVFVVNAQTPSDGRSPEKSWNFYFTEVNGKIYSLTTNTPPQFADRMALEAERFIASLYPANSQQPNR